MNEKNPLVSVITPCCNGETYVCRFLDSLIKQTYDNIEFIFINDGSKDNTENIVISYKDKFKQKGIYFKYIYQENKGVSNAINVGLKLFKGDYLIYPDSDDILYFNNIEERVNFLEKNKDCGLVWCKGQEIDELTGEKGREIERKKPEGKDTLFKDILIWRNVGALSSLMLRSSDFLKVNPNRHIYDSRTGQNYQMVLPIVYEYKCGYIDKCLWNYVIRKDSHSHKYRTNKEKIDLLKERKEVVFNVIKSMKSIPNLEKEKYYSMVDNFFKKTIRRKTKFIVDKQNKK